MAKAPKAAALALPGTTTGAIVILTAPVYLDANGEADPDSVTVNAGIQFNGALTAGGLGVQVTFARRATEATQQTAVRNAVNALLNEFEPGNSLSNANIQIQGLLK